MSVNAFQSLWVYRSVRLVARSTGEISELYHYVTHTQNLENNISPFQTLRWRSFWYISNRICQTKTKYCSKAIPNTKWPKTRSSWRHDVFEFWLYKNGQLLPTIKYSEIKSVMWRKIWLTHIIGDLYCQYNLEELNNFFIFSNKLLSYYKHFRRSILILVTIGRGKV